MKTCTKCGAEKELTEFYKKGKGTTSRCKPCIDADNRAWDMAHPEKLRASKREWRGNNPEKVKASQKKWDDAHPESIAASQRRWAESHPGRSARRREADPEGFNAYHREWQKEHPAQHAAQSAKRRAGQRSATPAWADKEAIKELYWIAQQRTINSGFPWHVDHIVPLIHPLVQGLHVEFNLHVIPGKHNIIKGNRYWPDMPEDSHG